MAGFNSIPNVLIVGDPRLGQFESIVRTVRQSVGDQSLRRVDDCTQLQSVTGEADRPPDLIIVLQVWPDQYSVADANQLISQFPLARLLCCCGPWCDSDGRTRSIWPLAVRVHPASFAARFAHELALIAGFPREAHRRTAASSKIAGHAGKAGQPLPLTASRSEIFEFDFDRQPTPFSMELIVAILSPDWRWCEMLAAALGQCGADITSDTVSAGVDVILFDIDPWNPDRASQFAIIRQRHPHATLIACCGFPRADLETEMRKSGADNVWFKLESLESLADQMIAAVERT
ncbi:MAG TPA: hypothetical protein VGM05_24730 [Planctomycetaceae bacterium]